MGFNIKVGDLDEALKTLEFEKKGELTDYEINKLAVELLKVSALKDISESISQGSEKIQMILQSDA